MKVTLQDIATEADVSVSTVSRVLSGATSISADCAAKVRAIAARLNYQAHRGQQASPVIRSLAKKNVGVLSLGIDRSLLSLPVVASAINGAEAALSEAGANVLLAHVPDLERLPPCLKDNRLDGLVLHGAMHGELGQRRNELFTRLRQIPSVWIMGRPQGCWGDSVTVDDTVLGSLAAEYLAHRGHQRVGFVSLQPNHPLLNRREDGFCARARRLGLSVERFCESPPGGWTLPLKSPASLDLVAPVVERLLAAAARPTAIFTAADSVAALLYRALADRELRVGREISIISANNDTPLAAGLHPHLTTFDVHADLVGRLAVQRLAARLAEAAHRPDVELLIEPTLVEGRSVVDLADRDSLLVSALPGYVLGLVTRSAH